MAASFGKVGAVMTAAITVPLGLMAKSMINAASDATETASKFNQVFDTVEGKANQVADEFSKSFGVAGSTARQMIGDTGDLLVGFGFTGDAALQMAKDVNELASDLASFQNFSGGAEGASIALTKALLGETESAKSLGIVIRQTTPEFRKNVEAIQRAKGVTLLQAKSIEILRIATSQSKKAVGDVNRTWDDYANVQRRSQEATKNLSESFGRLLIPLATKLTNLMTRVVNRVSQLSPGMKKFVLILGGLAAIGGPLLLVLAGIAAAFAAISLPILLISAGILALGGIIAAVALNWDAIVEGMKNTFVGFVNFVIDRINGLLAPLNFVAEKLGFGSLTIGQIGAPAAPATAPTSPAGGATVDGEIVVSATPGSAVQSTRLSGRGRRVNIGMNMAAAGA
jgi:hypothetical protein